jgi:alanine-glyoxylate transaminase/serine-glyoxylate transaminase/serine-pyruvate transaminase
MKAYEAGTPAYFATRQYLTLRIFGIGSDPMVAPVNLIYAFHTSLKKITQSPLSVDKRIRMHREASHRIKEAAANLGLRQVATDPAFAANGMTAVSQKYGEVFSTDARDDVVVLSGGNNCITCPS